MEIGRLKEGTNNMMNVSEDICARRFIFNYCRSKIKCLLTERHNTITFSASSASYLLLLCSS